MADELTQDAIVQGHIEAICDEAGLGVMVQVYEILLNRDEIDVVAILALTGNDVQRHYFDTIAPAIDGLEAELT